MSNEKKHFPVLNHPFEVHDEPSCSPKIYVSNEEASLLAALRELREQSLELRRKMQSAEGEERAALEAELERLRAKRAEVAEDRERAFTRKMIMLGHLPPDYPVD
jgi:hypothetical protein